MGFDQIKNIDQQNYDEGFLTWKQSIELAKNLLEGHKDEIKANQGKDVDGFDEGNIYSDYQKSIIYYLKNTPDEIKTQYTAHGITKGSEVDQLAAAISIIANKSIKGDTGKLQGSVYLDAYQKGNFIVLSKRGENLVSLHLGDSGRNVPIFNQEKAWEANIGAMVVDVIYYPLVDEIQKRFPGVNIIKANELPKYFKIEI